MDLEKNYDELLNFAVNEIKSARSKIARKINETTISVYWNIGRLLVERKVVEGYGSDVVGKLSKDLKIEFPELGFSPRNLWYMKMFYERFCNSSIKLQQSVAVLPCSQKLYIFSNSTTLKHIIF